MGSMNYYIERCLWSQTLSPEARPPRVPIIRSIGLLCIDERGVGLLESTIRHQKQASGAVGWLMH